MNTPEQGGPVWHWHLDGPCPLLSPLDQSLWDVKAVSWLLLGAVSAFLGQGPAERPEQQTALCSSALFLWFRLWRAPRPCAAGTCSSHDCTLAGHPQGKFGQPGRPQLPQWVLSSRVSSSPESATLMGPGRGPSGAVLVTVGVCASGNASPAVFLASTVAQQDYLLSVCYAPDMAARSEGAPMNPTDASSLT